jgi:hypothetical protein
MSQDAAERDYYRDTLLALFRILAATAFSPIGINVTHSFQANSYADVNEWEGKIPGFYAADLMLELDGVFPAATLTNYGIIETITATPVYQYPGYNAVTDTITVPLTE